MKVRTPWWMYDVRLRRDGGEMFVVFRVRPLMVAWLRLRAVVRFLIGAKS